MRRRVQSSGSRSIVVSSGSCVRLPLATIRIETFGVARGAHLEDVQPFWLYVAALLVGVTLGAQLQESGGVTSPTQTYIAAARLTPSCSAS